LRTSFFNLEAERICLLHRIAAVQALMRDALAHVSISEMKGNAADFAELILERQEQVDRLIIRTQICSASFVIGEVDENKHHKTQMAELKEEHECVCTAVMQLHDMREAGGLSEKESKMYNDISEVCDAASKIVTAIEVFLSHTIEVQDILKHLSPAPPPPLALSDASNKPTTLSICIFLFVRCEREFSLCMPVLFCICASIACNDVFQCACNDVFM
jgi:hypothetical protein